MVKRKINSTNVNLFPKNIDSNIFIIRIANELSPLNAKDRYDYLMDARFSPTTNYLSNMRLSPRVNCDDLDKLIRSIQVTLNISHLPRDWRFVTQILKILRNHSIRGMLGTLKLIKYYFRNMDVVEIQEEQFKYVIKRLREIYNSNMLERSADRRLLQNFLRKITNVNQLTVDKFSRTSIADDFEYFSDSEIPSPTPTIPVKHYIEEVKLRRSPREKKQRVC